MLVILNSMLIVIDDVVYVVDNQLHYFGILTTTTVIAYDNNYCNHKQ